MENFIFSTICSSSRLQHDLLTWVLFLTPRQQQICPQTRRGGKVEKFQCRIVCPTRLHFGSLSQNPSVCATTSFGFPYHTECICEAQNRLGDKEFTPTLKRNIRQAQKGIEVRGGRSETVARNRKIARKESEH